MSYSYTCKSVKEKIDILNLIHSIHPNYVGKNLYERYLESIEFMTLLWEYRHEMGSYCVVGCSSKASWVTQLDYKDSFLRLVLGNDYNPISPLKTKISYNFI